MDIDNFYKTYGEVELQKQQRLLETIDTSSKNKLEATQKSGRNQKKNTFTSSDYF